MNAWDVLDYEPLLAKAREQFEDASINPFYSNPDHTLREGAVYLVAQNPGGDAREIPSQTREKPLDHPPRAAQRVDWCKPLDEVWGIDGTNYQRNIVFLAEQLLPGGSEALRETFCTNGVFVRGRLGAPRVDVSGIWALCRPWHEAWLRRVSPRVLICLGNGKNSGPYSWFTGLLHDRTEHQEVPTYNRAFSLKSCEGRLLGTPVTVIGTPHPSRWHPGAPGSAKALAEARRLMRTALAR